MRRSLVQTGYVYFRVLSFPSEPSHEFWIMFIMQMKDLSFRDKSQLSRLYLD